MENLNINLGTIFIAIIIIGTIIGVIKGLLESRDYIKGYMNGKKYEEVVEMKNKKEKEKEDKQRAKFGSKFYCITHPLDYMNMKMFDKLEENNRGVKLETRDKILKVSKMNTKEL